MRLNEFNGYTTKRNGVSGGDCNAVGVLGLINALTVKERNTYCRHADDGFADFQNGVIGQELISGQAQGMTVMGGHRSWRRRVHRCRGSGQYAGCRYP